MGDQHKKIGELIHAVMPHGKDFDNMLLNIYDRQGQLMEFSFEHGTNKISPLKTIELNDMLMGSNEKIIEDDKIEYFSVLSPIINDAGELQGAVEVLLSLDQINHSLTGIVRKFVAFILLTAALLGVLIYIICRLSISLPITRLKDASEKLGHGNLGLRIQKSGVRELDDLIEQFNRMAKNIERQNQKKEKLFDEKIILERRLRHADKLASIGQLASGLAHEIGTPLNVISGRAEHLLTKLKDDHPGVENLQNIIRQSERITKTMQQMLAFSRKPEAQFSEVDLKKTTKEAFSLCQLKKRKGHSQVNLELDLNIPTIQADEDSLRQLFVNLMLNSFYAMPEGGDIKITSDFNALGSSEVLIIYEDNGCGIPSEQKSRVFDPFYTTKDVGEGTGLGLFMVANIVQEHQGQIELDNAFKSGARFVIQLPQTPTTISNIDKVSTEV